MLSCDAISVHERHIVFCVIISSHWCYVLWQICGVYNGLVRDRNWECSLVDSVTRLSLKPTTQLIISTPTALTRYHLKKILRPVHLLCVDEADILLTGSEKAPTWEILGHIRTLYKADISAGYQNMSEKDDCDVGSSSEQPFVPPPRQLIFSAATLPSGGPMTVLSLMRKWLPRSTLYISTDQTHRPVPSAQVTFTEIASHSDSSENLFQCKFQHLLSDLSTLCSSASPDKPQVMIFCRTVGSAKLVYEELVKSASSNLPWAHGTVGQLHKKIGTSERYETVQRFNSRQLRVLVCTDLASRGLDFRDVTAVVQFDFPLNSADFLHRAGRTARAGKIGRGKSKCFLVSSSVINKVERER